MNWKIFLEDNYSFQSEELQVKFLSPNMGKYEDKHNIQIISSDGFLKIGIWSDENFNELFDIDINIKNEPNLGFVRHFEGMEYSKENEKFLRRYLDSFLIKGWIAIDCKFLRIYKTEMMDLNQQNNVGPTHYYSAFSLLYDLLSFGGLFTKRIEKKFDPIIKTVC